MHRFTLALLCGSITGALAGGDPAASQALTPEDKRGLRAAWEASRHAFSEDPEHPGQWRTRNPGQQWRTRIDADGFTTLPGHGEWTWGLELESYGHGKNQQCVRGPATISADGSRMSCRQDPRLEEWFVNDTRGLEHGFTLADAPPRDPSAAAHETLDFHLKTRGGLTPRLMTGARGVEFLNAAGTSVLTYDGLKVWDADGKILTATFSVEGAMLRLSVDDEGARYPLTIDPIAQQAYLKSPRSEAGDNFGYAVAVWGNTAVVTAPNDDWEKPAAQPWDHGAAFVYVRNGGVWTQQAELRISLNFTPSYAAGRSVAIWGDAIVLGVPFHDARFTGDLNVPDYDGSGAVFVFHRSGTTWTEAGILVQPFFTSTDRGAFDFMGFSVAIHGNTIVVGAPYESSASISAPSDNSLYASGSAYVYEATPAGYVRTATLKSPSPQLRGEFGYSVAVSGDSIIVGSPGENSNATGINGTAGPGLAANSSGAAFAYRRSGSAWLLEAYLKPHNTHASQAFGHSVAIDGATAVVGSPAEASGVSGAQPLIAHPLVGSGGAAYVFNRNASTGWSAQAMLKPFTLTGSINFGSAVAISGETVLIGAPTDPNINIGVDSVRLGPAGGLRSGAAYAYRRSGAVWSPYAYLRPSHLHQYGELGRAIGIWGDTMILGATGDNSEARGINGPAAAAANLPASGGACIFDNVPVAPSSYDVWRTGVFGAAHLTPATAQTADPDLDGLDNFHEYAFGLNAAVPDRGSLPAITRSGSLLTGTFTEPYAVQGLRYTIQSSQTLAPGSWVDEPDLGSGRTHLFQVPMNTPKKFLRWHARPQ